METPKLVPIELDPDWSARQVADEVRRVLVNRLADRPLLLDLAEFFSDYSIHESELWAIMTSEEREGIPDIPIIGMPTGEFTAWIAMSPNGEGQFVVVDLCIVWELVSFLSAIGSQAYPAWMACTLQGALRSTHVYWDKPLPRWVEAAAREMASYKLPSGLRGEVTYTKFSSMLVGLQRCMMFILAHEYAHHKLGHLAGPSAVFQHELGGTSFADHTISHEHELQADAMAVDITSRVPTGYLVTWILSIELMFWYLSLIDLFNTECERINGQVSQPKDHPTPLQRAEKISREAQACLTMRLQSKSDDSKLLNEVLEERQRIFKLWKTMCRYTTYLAENYCNAPDRTLALHEAVLACNVDRSGYQAEMEAIQAQYGGSSPLIIGRRLVRHWKSRLF